MSPKTVFISYRRDDTGKSFARNLKQGLTHRGYDAFLDVDDMPPGHWDEQIPDEVRHRSHFLLVLTPGALDRCDHEDDWVRREFEIAVTAGRNIVPVHGESVDPGKLRQACPECMKGVFRYQCCPIRHKGFEKDIDELESRFIPRHKAPGPVTPHGPPPLPAAGLLLTGGLVSGLRGSLDVPPPQLGGHRWDEQVPAAEALTNQRLTAALPRGLCHLLKARACLVDPGGSGTATTDGAGEIEQALDFLRKSGFNEFVVRALLIRARFASLDNRPQDARTDIQNAREIATGQKMALNSAEVDLEEAVFLAQLPDMQEQARQAIRKAVHRLEELDYGRLLPRARQLAQSLGVLSHT
ncbi:MAG: toll/interleukin-1 receptor domain-containing protein [Thermodesulfobacteriota bacterium]